MNFAEVVPREIEREIGVAVLTQDVLTILGLLVSPFAYPLRGSFAIELCGEIRDWAYENKATKWTKDQRAQLSAAWPAVLIGFLIVYPFVGIINRIY